MHEGASTTPSTHTSSGGSGGSSGSNSASSGGSECATGGGSSGGSIAAVEAVTCPSPLSDFPARCYIHACACVFVARRGFLVDGTVVHTSREENFPYDFVLGSGAVRLWAESNKGLRLFGGWVWDWGQ